MDNVTMARINLFAILRNLEDLCSLDSKAQEIIKGKKISVQFNVKRVGSATLVFDDGKCKFLRSKQKANLKLYFTSPEHFNKLIDGKKTIPLFFNIFRVGFLLKTFTLLAERLSYFLKPDEELLKDAEYFKINTFLTSYTAFFALCEIGNSDRVGKIISKKIPEGEIQLSIKDGPQMVITVDENHRLSNKIGSTDNPRAIMQFKSLKTANNILNGKEDVFGALGAGSFEIKGLLPMLDNMNKLLSKVSKYLSGGAK